MLISVTRKKNLKCKALTKKGIPCKYKPSLIGFCTTHFILYGIKKKTKKNKISLF